MLPLVQKITGFIREIGIPVSFRDLRNASCFLPGILIEHGSLAVDADRLLYPGDLLHEAGHIAVVPAADRKDLDAEALGTRPDNAAEEMMAMAWSYAAARHLELDPAVVFHDNGYKGGGANLLQSFEAPQPIGVPMLQYIGLCRTAAVPGTDEMSFPAMRRWLRE